MTGAHDLRCASLTRAEGHAPLGTAGDHRGYLLVDWPLPWPSDIGDIPELAPAHERAARLGVRVQAVAPPGGDGRRHVVLHRSDGRGFAGYRRTWRAVRPGGVVEAAVALLAAWEDARDGARPPGDGGPHAAADGGGDTGPPGDGNADATVDAGGDADPACDADAAVDADPAAADPYPAAGAGPAGGGTGPRGDVLVCAHGRRDPCCGRDGTLLAAELLVDPDLRAAGYRVGRTSHTGGHRFAPTAIVLPEGTMWAFLDAESVRTVVGRRGPVEAVLPSFRGSTGLGSPALQALERHAFAEVGWGWLDWRRSGHDDGDGGVTLVGEAPGGARASWRAAFASTARPVPDCGKPLDEARKHHDEPVLRDVRRIA